MGHILSKDLNRSFKDGRLHEVTGHVLVKQNHNVYLNNVSVILGGWGGQFKIMKWLGSVQ